MRAADVSAKWRGLLPDPRAPMALGAWLLELSGERAQRLAAVTAGILVGGRHLCRSDRHAGRLKDRVVAESAGTARRIQNSPFPRALRDQRRRVIGSARENDHALVPRR